MISLHKEDDHTRTLIRIKGMISNDNALAFKQSLLQYWKKKCIEKCWFNLPILFVFVLQYSFESLFRSMHFALLDNSCREYLFLADFFMAQNNAAKDLFTAVFGKTLSLFLVSTRGVS